MHIVNLSRRKFMQGAAALGLIATATPRLARAEGHRVLRARSASDIQDIDPGDPAAGSDQDVMMAIFNKLVAYDPTSTNWGWELEAATSVEQLDPVHVRFTLMPGVEWTNGFGEMTSEDVKYSFERIADPDFGSWARVDWEQLKEVRIVDKYTGVITLNEPFAPLFFSTLPYGSGTIICKKAVDALPEKRFTTDPPASSGPYRIKRWVPKQQLVLERHAGWPGPKPDFDEIHILPIEDAKTGEIAFEAGELDITRLAISSVQQYREAPPENSTLVERPSLFYEWLGMNVEHPPFDDPRVRQAVQYAVDVDSVIEAAYFGVPERATGIIAPGLVGHRPENLIEHPDLDRARGLLAEAGHPDGFRCTLDVHNVTDHVSAAQVIQADLARIGIEVQINQHDSGTFWVLGIEAEGDAWKDVQLVYNRYSMAPDPFWATAWFVPEQVGEWNWERWNSPEYGELHRAAVREADLARRGTLYHRMQDLMEASGAYVFVTHGVNAFIHRNDVVPALRPDGGNYLFRKFRGA